MIDDHGANAILRGLLETAIPFDPAEAPRPAYPKAARPARGNPAGNEAVQLVRVQSAVQLLRSKGLLNIGSYIPWRNLAIELKNDLDEAAWPLFFDTSSNDPSFVSEEDCRRTWNGIRTDRPEGARRTCASIFKEAIEAGWKDPTRSGDSGGRFPRDAGRDSAGEAGDDEGGNLFGVGPAKKPDAASVVVAQAEAAGDEHFLALDGRAHATYTRKRADGSEHRMTVKLDGSDYRLVLGLRYYDEAINHAAPRDQITNAMSIMEARARASNVRHAVHLRVAHHDGRVYVNVDPDEGVVAEIDTSPEEWRIVDDAPVRFVAGSRGPLANPERGGTLELMDKHYNVDGGDLTRVIAFMLSPFMERGPYPILDTEGEAGSAKSTLNDKIMAVVDPPRGDRASARFSIATEERNLHIQASHCSVVGLDNISHLSAEIADQLCRLATGAASSFRVHHSMDEEQQFAVARPVVFSSIGIPTSRTDLLSRSLCVTAKRIEHRRTERAVWRDFDADAGKMVGFLFSCVSEALRNHAAVAAQVEAGELALPRMADFAEWVEAAGAKLGIKRGGFAKLLTDEQASMQADAVQGDLFVDTFQRYFSQPGANTINMTARELLDLVQAQDEHAELPGVKAVKGRLQRIAQGLRDSGFDMTIGKDAHSKTAMFNVQINEAFVAKNMPARKPSKKAF